MRTKGRITGVVVSVIGFTWLLGSAPADAQALRSKHKRQHDRIERAKDRREVRDDHRDLQKIVDIAGDWNKARKLRNKDIEKAVDARLWDWLRAELRESEHEAAEARDKAITGRPGLHRRDEVRDAQEKVADARRTRVVARKLYTLQKKFQRGSATPADYREKKRLLKDLVRLAQEELRESREELRENRRHHR